MKAIARLLLILTAVWISLGTVQAQDFFARLVYAYNHPSPEHNDERLDVRTREKLKKVFGYQHYRVLHEAASPLARIKSDFPPLGPDFSLSIEQLERRQDRFKLKINFFHKEKSLVSSKFDFSEDAPLFIKGPPYDQGTLVLVILMK